MKNFVIVHKRMRSSSRNFVIGFVDIGKEKNYNKSIMDLNALKKRSDCGC